MLDQWIGGGFGKLKLDKQNFLIVGIEIFHFNPRSERLAANVLKETLRAYPTTNRGVKTARFHVLRNNRRAAILCELGFLSNPRDNSQVQKAAVRQRLAERIAAGILAERAGRSP